MNSQVNNVRNPEYFRAYRKQWKANRLALGLCLYCSDGKASGGHPTCQERRDIAKIKAAHRRAMV